MVAALPEDPALRRELAVLEDLSGNPESALREIDAALALDPSRESLRVDRAMMLARAGRVEEAVRSLEEFLARAPSGPDAERARGLLAELSRGTLARED